MIKSGYHLPFQFRYCEGVFSSGGDAQLIVHTNNPKHKLPVQQVIHSFSSLAATGAFSGDQIPPWKSTFNLSSVVSSANELRCYLESCYLADEALIVLAHMLLAAHEESTIEVINMVSTQPKDQNILEFISSEKTIYPALYSHLPFVLSSQEPEGGGYTFLIDLEAPLEHRHELYLNNALGSWIDAVLTGGYSPFPLDPKKCYVEPDDKEVTTYETKVEWAIFKLHADPASLDGLMNLLIAFHMRCQRIVHVEIS